jgi:diguanylate cyclase (GGDEF)-like protein/PAS domain S-box-containing protein
MAMFAAARPGAYRQPAGATEPDHPAIRSAPTSDVGLGQLLNLAQDMLCVAGFDGYLKRVNPAWERALGWTAEELTSRPYVEYMHPADRVNGSDEAWTRVDGQSVARFENRYLCRDGSYRWLSWMATPNVDEGLIYAAARDVTALKHHGQMAAAMTAVTRIAAECTDWDEAGWQILKAVCTSLDWDIGALWMVDTSEQQLVCRHAYFASDDIRDLLGTDVRHARRRLGESLVGLAWERDEPLLAEDVLSDERFAAPPSAIRAALGGGFAFPFRHSGEVVGVIGFGSRDVEIVDPELRVATAALAEQIEALLDRLATSRQMYHMAFHDSLTGLPNLALFRERANQALAMSRRLQTRVGIALADVDQFKEINDTFGHAAGDDVLRHVGAHMLDSLRGSDTVARLGGDEFGILFPATTAAGVERAIRKLRARVSEGVTVGDQRRTVRVSLGYAIAAGGEQGLDELLKLADSNMYRDKGRRSSGGGEVRGGRPDASVRLGAGEAPDGKGGSRRPDHSWSAL